MIKDELLRTYWVTITGPSRLRRHWEIDYANIQAVTVCSSLKEAALSCKINTETTILSRISSLPILNGSVSLLVSETMWTTLSRSEAISSLEEIKRILKPGMVCNHHRCLSYHIVCF
jgi:hypothetical protein